MIAMPLAQSVDTGHMPYVTVQTDERGSACWVVVGRDSKVRCYSGQQAINVMEMMCRAKGIPVP